LVARPTKLKGRFAAGAAIQSRLVNWRSRGIAASAVRVLQTYTNARRVLFGQGKDTVK
jgi:hypothetical protein